MAIERIDQGKCTGCGICINSCPLDVIQMNEENKKAFIKYKEECMICHLCAKYCPVQAIYISSHKTATLSVSWG